MVLTPLLPKDLKLADITDERKTTTFVLIPMVRDAVSIPLIAAGGIGSGRSMLAAEVLGAGGVQIGSRFAVSHESSAHQNFKEMITQISEGDTIVTLKQLTPVRLVKNKFYEEVRAAVAVGIRGGAQ